MKTAESVLTQLSPATKRAITRFDKAAQEYANRGSQDLEDAEDIEVEYARSRVDAVGKEGEIMLIWGFNHD